MKNIFKKRSPAEQYFPKAAVDYIDALLSLQNEDNLQREQLLAVHYGARAFSDLFSKIKRPRALLLQAEEDAFIGGGWSTVQKSPRPHRWMQRVGGLLLFVDLRQGGTIVIKGPHVLRAAFLRGLTVWIDGVPIVGQLKSVPLLSAFFPWQFEGMIPPLETKKPYHLLQIKAPALAKKAAAPFDHASLAVDQILIEAAG